MELSWLFLKRTDKQGWFRNVVIVFAIMLATAILLSAMAFGNASSENMRRMLWETNLFYQNTNTYDGNPSSLKGKTLIQLSSTALGDEGIKEIGIRQIDSDSPLLPNLVRQPAEKELFVSKGMMDFINTNPILKERYAGYDVKIAVPDSLLSTPNKRLVIYRIPDEQLKLNSKDRNGFGIRVIDSNKVIKADKEELNRTRIIINVFMALCGIGVCFPLLILVISATRVGMMQREQRYAALSLIGSSKRQINQIILAETLAFSGLAILLGTGLYQILKYTVLANLKLGDDVLFLSDYKVTPSIFVAVIGLVLLIAVMVNWIALLKVKTSPLGVVKNQRKLRKPTVFGLLPMLLAIGGIWKLNQLGPEWFLEQGSASLLYFVITFVLMMIGLVVSGPILTFLSAKVIGYFGNNATTIMSGKRMQMFSRSIFSSVSGVVLALFVGSFFMSMAASVEQTYRQYYGRTVSTVALANSEIRPGVLRYRAETDSDLKNVLNRIAQDPELSKTLVKIKDTRYYFQTSELADSTDTDKQIFGNIYSCKEVSELTRLQCPKDYQDNDQVIFYINHRANESKLIKLDKIMLEKGTVENKTFEKTLVFESAEASRSGRKRMQNIIAAAMYETGFNGHLRTDNESYDPLKGISGLLQAVMAGTVMTIFVAGFSLAVSTIGAFFERKKSFYNLRLMGTDIKMLNRVVMIESFIPLALASIVAMIAGIMTSRYLGATMSQQFVFAMPTTDYFVAIGLSLTATVVIILMILPILKKITSFEENRNE